MDHFKKRLEIAKSIPFTYTIIVQCILQVLHSFWTCFTPKMAILKRSNNGNFEAVKKWQKWTFLGLILGRFPTGYMGAPHWVTHRWGHHLAFRTCFPCDASLHFSAWHSSSALANSSHRVVLVEVVSTWHTYQCVLHTFVVVLIPNSP